MWQPKEHIGAQLIYEPGALGWNELYTYDTEAAAGFYANVFGWSRAATHPDPQGGHTTSSPMAKAYGGRNDADQTRMGRSAPNWSVYFCVADCAASLQEAESMGAEVIVPLTQVDNISFAFLKDPVGVYFGISQVVG